MARARLTPAQSACTFSSSLTSPYSTSWTGTQRADSCVCRAGRSLTVVSPLSPDQVRARRITFASSSGVPAEVCGVTSSQK